MVLVLVRIKFDFDCIHGSSHLVEQVLGDTDAHEIRFPNNLILPTTSLSSFSATPFSRISTVGYSSRFSQMSEQVYDQLNGQQCAQTTFEQAAQVTFGYQNTILYPGRPLEIKKSFEVGEGEKNIILPPGGDQSQTQYKESFNVVKGSGNVIMSADHPCALKAVEDALKLLYPNDTESCIQPTQMDQVVEVVVEPVAQTAPLVECTPPKKSHRLVDWLFHRKKNGSKQNKELSLSKPTLPAFGKRPSDLHEVPLPQVPRIGGVTETYQGELTLL
ncbi:hypothetical protein D9756_002878 [Leucocoprinus leucothites]|uniref:Uncharacterized protein n=1 Tax=Leucocoprinus leucothites TaxID=201217 RepID=A0A8H5G782_9AGAR|nr:hypothetical protein D9756_002878 [Leucoagaricus leucothites]